MIGNIVRKDRVFESPQFFLSGRWQCALTMIILAFRRVKIEKNCLKIIINTFLPLLITKKSAKSNLVPTSASKFERKTRFNNA